MNREEQPDPRSLSLDSSKRVDELCDRFEAAFNAGERPCIEEYLAEVAESAQPALLRELLLLELDFLRDTDEAPDQQALVGRFPDYADVVHSVFEEISQQMRDTSVVSATHTYMPASDALKKHGDAVGAAGNRFGDYEIEAEIGRGGMGVVFKAMHRQSGRRVALKLILSPLFREELLARFHREGETIAKLEHQNIIKIHEIGCVDGVPYLSLELAEGGNLATRLLAGVTPLQVAGLVGLIAKAVGHAHDRGIVHRDLKPTNILVAGDATLKITDYGLVKQLPESEMFGCTISTPRLPDFLKSAKLTGPDEFFPSLSIHERTNESALLGTPAYMAPEQALRQSSSIGLATDVYALGVMLYEMLTGRRPSQSLQDVIEVNPSPPSSFSRGIPAELDRICVKCLEKDPTQRYHNANALSDDLKKFAGLTHFNVRDCLSASPGDSSELFYERERSQIAVTEDYRHNARPTLRSVENRFVKSLVRAVAKCAVYAFGFAVMLTLIFMPFVLYGWAKNGDSLIEGTLLACIFGMIIGTLMGIGRVITERFSDPAALDRN